MPFRSLKGETTPATLCVLLRPPSPPTDGLWYGIPSGSVGLRVRHVALDLSPYLLPKTDCPQLLRGPVSNMLGLEMVRLRACLNRVTRPYRFNSAQPQAACAGTVGLPRSRKVRTISWGRAHSSPELGWTGSEPSPGEGGTSCTPIPSRRPYSVRGHLPLPRHL